jgi:uncharacterized protein YcbX
MPLRRLLTAARGGSYGIPWMRYLAPIGRAAQPQGGTGGHRAPIRRRLTARPGRGIVQPWRKQACRPAAKPSDRRTPDARGDDGIPGGGGRRARGAAWPPEPAGMTTVGRVESLWRYPVKSMRGEELTEAFLGFAGVYGDRLYAFRSAARPAGFPYLTGRELARMLLYRPRFRDAARAVRPPNLAAAEAMGPGITPLPGDPADLALEVETPEGDVLAIDDPALLARLGAGGPDGRSLSLLRSERALTDCRPLSLLSLQTVRQLADETGGALDKRRFRANLHLDLGAAPGFAEDGFVGRRLRLGPKAVVAVLERDPRCKMIGLDPDTAEPSPAILRRVTRAHGGMAGVYAAVLVEGMVQQGAAVELLD